MYSVFFIAYNLIQVTFDPESRRWFCKRCTSIRKGNWTLGLDVVQWSVLGPSLCMHFINERYSKLFCLPFHFKYVLICHITCFVPLVLWYFLFKPLAVCRSY